MNNHLSSHSQDKNLHEWLSYIESIHAVEIDLGLARIKQVASRLSLDLSRSKIITVAGTNGKGTTCAFIEQALMDEGSSVAVYSSPHIEHFNERLRINLTDIDDESLVLAFEQIERARINISLSYYEFTTLAAFIILQKVQPDYIILEVGLGGRLDATNMVDADIAVITTVDLDHQAFLGNTREAIAFEKAGIMRAERWAVVGDINPTKSLLDHSDNIGAKLQLREQAFCVTQQDNSWTWQDQQSALSGLQQPHIPLDNVATALQVLSLLSIPLTQAKANQWIAKTKVAGRTELFTQPCHTILDVGHNPQAARYLAQNIQQRNYAKVHAVVGMLSDKDIQGTLEPLKQLVSTWAIADLAVYRGAQAKELKQHLATMVADKQQITCFSSVTDAYLHASKNAQVNELVLVFGSFYTVAEIRPLLIT